MEVSSRAFLLWILLATIASQDILIPVLGWCGHSRSPCSPSPHGGSYYPPSHTPSPKPPSSSPPKSPCPTPKSPSPSPKTPSPSPCSKTPSCPQTKPPTTPSPKPPTTTTPTPNPPTTPSPYPPSTTPNTPTTPSPKTPGMPPFLGHPIVGPCTYWLAHPEFINKILGMWGPIGHMFGAPPFPSMFGGIPSVPQVLQNTRTDGFGCLLRECAAALLNSISGYQSGAFPFSTRQVQDSFIGALVSESAAAAQAEVFKAANEGRLH